MNQIVNFVMQNSAWFIGGLILIILAVIGYYADKTNFGQGKTTESEKNNNNNNKIIDENNFLEEVDSNLTNDEKTIAPQENILEEKSTQQLDFLNKVEDKLSKDESKTNDIKENLPKKQEVNTAKTVKPKKSKLTAEEAAFDKFEKEFESLLPKKELINADLLSDIDELELGKTQKIKLNEVPDLDDIDLPKIKKLVNDEEDIWKF